MYIFYILHLRKKEIIKKKKRTKKKDFLDERQLDTMEIKNRKQQFLSRCSKNLPSVKKRTKKKEKKTFFFLSFLSLLFFLLQRVNPL